MRLTHLRRVVLLAASGTVLFQSTSCADELFATLITAVTSTLSTAVASGLSDYINQILGTTA